MNLDFLRKKPPTPTRYYDYATGEMRDLPHRDACEEEPFDWNLVTIVASLVLFALAVLLGVVAVWVGEPTADKLATTALILGVPAFAIGGGATLNRGMM